MHVQVSIESIKDIDLNVARHDTVIPDDFIRYPFVASTNYTVQPQFRFFVSAYSGVFANNIRYSPKFVFFDTIIKPCLSNNYGLQLGFNHRRISLATGLEYAIIKDKLDFERSSQRIDSTIIMHTHLHQQLVVDTVWFLNLDSLTHGDTVWMPFYDSNYVKVTDTVYVTSYDTTSYNINYDRLNTIQNIRIPIIFSYNFRISKYLKIGINPGIIANFTVINSYAVPDLNNQYNLTNIQTDFSALLYLSGSIEFYARRKTSVFANLYGSYPIFPFYSFASYKAKYYSYGISIGMKFYF